MDPAVYRRRAGSGGQPKGVRTINLTTLIADQTELIQWIVLGLYGLLLIYLSPAANNAETFYQGKDKRGRSVNLWLLSGSVFITWIFAKSITNAANLGAAYGLVGGMAYAGWYLSIPVAALVIYGLRKWGGFSSIPEFLQFRYGKFAVLTFMLAIFIRLFNEIWSNTIVVGSYFGDKGTAPFYAAAVIFTLFTLIYSVRGGLRSSLITDAIQVVLMVFFLTLVLGWIVPGRSGELMSAGEFTMKGGIDLLLVGLLQSLSYPFHDPVLTDRGFLSNPRTMLKGFFIAGGAGILCIVVFSLVGVHAFVEGMSIQDDAPPQVAASLGITVLTLMNIIMLSSAGSTIDSTFASLSREIGLDLPTISGWFEPARIGTGRIAMVIMAIVGNIPIFFGAKIFHATTISGTMVMGLAPIFLLFWWKRPGPIAFHLAFWPGLTLGVYEVVRSHPSIVGLPDFFILGNGPYGALLGINFYGLILCTGLFVVGAWTPRYLPVNNHG